jgi:4-hydroxy-4-methyl-2-oxoglutarate aldolase
VYDINRNVRRPDGAVVAALAKYQTAVIHEAIGKRGAFPHTVRPVWPESVVCGVALTVHARPADNLLIHKAVEMASPGDVLVVENGGFLEAGIWGEILTLAAMQKGIVGLITNGAIRDTVQIKALGFPVFSGGVSIKGTTKFAPGEINAPVYFEGVEVCPGDIIAGDNDGIVVIPYGIASEAVQLAGQKDVAEAKMMERVKNGESTMDILNLGEPFAALGLKTEE